MLHAFFPIGEIVKPQGIRGEVKVLPDTSYPQHMAKLAVVYHKNGENYAPINVEKARVQDGCLYYQLEGIDDRNKAESWRGVILFVDRAHHVPLEEGENYIGDLEGCKVVTEDGTSVGTLESIIHPAAQDLYTVKTADEKHLVFPSVPGLILNADPANDLIMVSAKTLSEVSLLED